jgi:lipoate-protein ligase B
MHVPGRFLEIGLTDYQEACAIQMALHQARVEETIGDTLILTEHLPVYTLGRTAREQHVGEGWQRGVINGIPVCVSDRGGSVTYHGPGQLVGYPIVRLRDHCQGPKAYMNQLEEIVIRALEAFGLVSGRRQGMPGVWIEDRKIAAMGVRISRGVTRHGFALNVVNDLAPFSAIVPCGLSGLGVTSISRELGAPVGLDRAMRAVVEAVQGVFGFALLEARV